MGKVVFDISMSLDGFMTAANQTPEEPLGKGGQQLHDWAMNDADAAGRKILEGGIASIGAVIGGRKTYNDSIPWWGADGPTGPAQRPLFVVTHQAPAESPEGGVYTFVTDGIESALAQARAVAGEKDISVMGGANIGQQYIAAGLVDEISIHLVPVLFGGGTRMFEHLGDEHIQLEMVDTIATPVATHLRFRVVK
jgi:dihydrofolate reductase